MREKLSVEDAFYAWLIEHVCDMINKFVVRKGGKTSWEQLKSGPFTGEIYPFGSPVLHRTSGPLQGGVMQERWHDGIWLGLHYTSGEHFVALDNGIVVRARAVTPKPASSHATKSALVNIKTRPWESTGVITQDTASKPPRSTDPPSGPSASDPVPRGLRITRALLEKYSLTKGCPKCEAIRREDDSNTVHHNRECRKRIESAMAEDNEHSSKLRKSRRK